MVRLFVARLGVIAVSAVFVFVDTGVAFSGPEHRRVSANAFQIAEAFVRAHSDRTFTSVDEAVIASFRGSVGLSYAEMVVSIDHTVDPLRVLERAEQVGTLPRAVPELDPYIVESVIDPRLAGLRAVTVNDMHFQAQLTTNLRLYHLYAVQLAAFGDRIPAKSPSERSAELFTALAINAIADHLLQDFFAPGHIVTPRYGVHDAVALGSHDKYNILGSYFVIDRQAFDRDLKPLLEFLPASAIRPFAFDIQSALVAAEKVPLWGDGNLSRSPRQELLLTLLTARSIVDILDSYLHMEPTNSFRGITFHAAYRAASYAEPSDEEKLGCPRYGKLHLATAGLPYGRYVHPCQYEGSWAAPAIVGLALGSEALYQGGQVTTRYLAGLEYLFAGTTIHGEDNGEGKLIQRPREREWAATIGLSYGQNHVQTATGVALRMVMALPLIHTQIGAQVNERIYKLRSAFVFEDARNKSGKLGWSVDVQTGFSFLKFDLGTGRDYAFVGGGLRRATLFRTGAYFELPSTLLGAERWFERARHHVIQDRFENVSAR